MSHVAERTAVVTGGSTGIGFDIAASLLETGYRVAFFGSSPKHVDDAAAKLRQRFPHQDLFADTIDIRESGSLAAFFARVLDMWGPVSVLINNAGISPKRDGLRIPFHEIPLTEWHDVLGINLTGAFVCSQLALPSMIEQHFGRIVMIGSIAARTLPRLAGASYVASKAGMTGLARSIAGEYAGHGITANVIAPGNIATGMLAKTANAEIEQAVSRIPVGRLGEPADVAGIVAFLCREEASFINGAVIDANGAEYCAP
jgi:3-oxoacyl-[acyl-carrier protein] reductase